MSWTQFWDMHSGGHQKLAWAMIFIEAPVENAKQAFEILFNRDPDTTTCDCCGPDYSIHEGDTLEELTEYHRDTAHQTHEEYCARTDVKVVSAQDWKEMWAKQHAGLVNK